jgi:hypothetical protein
LQLPQAPQLQNGVTGVDAHGQQRYREPGEQPKRWGRSVQLFQQIVSLESRRTQ